MPETLNPTKIWFLEKFVCKRKIDLPDWDAHYQGAVDATNAMLTRLRDMRMHIVAPEVIAKIEAKLAKAATLTGRAAFDEASHAGQSANHHLLEFVKGQDLLRKLLATVQIPSDAMPEEVEDLRKRLARIEDLMANKPASDADYGEAMELWHTFNNDLSKLPQDRGTERAAVAHMVSSGVKTLDAIDRQLAKLSKPNAPLVAQALALRNDILALQPALDSKEAYRISLAHGELPDLSQRLTQLETDADKAATDDLRIMIPTNPGCSDAELDALLEIGKDDPETMFAAISVLREMDKHLQGASVDQHNLKNRALAVAHCEADALQKREVAKRAKANGQPLFEDWQAAEEVLDAKDKALGAANAAAHEFYADNRAALENSSHADHDRLKKAYAKLYKAYEAAEAQHREAKQKSDEKFALFEPARLAFEAANEEHGKSIDAYEDATEKQKAALGKRRLLDAVRFGELSPGHAHQVTDPVAKDLIELFKQNPEVAHDALAAAARAEHPESVALCAQTICKRLDSGFQDDTGRTFPDTDTAIKYGQQLLDMSAALPPEAVQNLDAYLAAGRHLDDVAGIKADPKDPAATGKARVNAVGARMIGDDGALDLAAGRDAMLDLAFHPDGVTHGSVAQVKHMYETLDFFDGSPEAQALIGGATVPSAKEGQALVFRTMDNNDTFEVTDNDTRKALVTAMMTPVYQGKVGSCFVTATVVKMRNEAPMQMMRQMAQLADTGTFIPAEGDAVRAVQQVPENENALLRSYEYTLAQATSRQENNIRQQELDAGLASGMRTLKKAFKPDRSNAIMQRIQQAINDAVEYKYFPTAETETGEDGSSDRGVFKLVRKMGGQPIETDKDFHDVVYRAVKDVVGKDDLVNGLSLKRFMKEVAKPAFVKKFKTAKGKAFRPRSGGHSHETARVLDGDEHSLDTLTQPVDAKNMDRAKRATDLLVGLVGLDGGGMKGVSAHRHAFNAVPDDPSMQALKGDTAEETRANVQRELVDKAVEVSDTAMPLERVIYLFDKEMARAVGRVKGAVKAALEDAWSNKGPTQAMTPPEFAAHLKDAMGPATELLATDRADKERKKRADAGKPMSTEDYEAFKKTEIETQTAGRKKQLSARMVSDLGLPEIVVADTNWGDPEKKIVFVMVPDPVSGTPKLFKRYDPEGTLKPQSDEDGWLAADWRNVA